MPTRKKTGSKNLRAMLEELSTLVTSIQDNYRDVNLTIVRMVQDNIINYQQLVKDIASLNPQNKQKEEFEKLKRLFNASNGLIEKTHNASLERVKAVVKTKEDISKKLIEIVQTKDAYLSASQSNKNKLLALYKSQQEVLRGLISSLARDEDTILYSNKLSTISKEVNARTEQLKAQEVPIEGRLRLVANEKAEVVKGMSIQECLLSLAPPQVQTAVNLMLSGSRKVGLLNDRNKPVIADGMMQRDIIPAAVSQAMDLTGGQGEMNDELAAITRLSPQEQQQLVQALFSGEMSLDTQNSTSHLALMAAVINQLAFQTGMPKEDRLAVKEFAQDIIKAMDRVAKKERSYLSIVLAVTNELGERELRSFHIDLNLFKKPVDLSVLLSLALLKAGARSDTPVMTKFTSLEQVGTLCLLEGKTAAQFAIQNQSLLQIAAMAINNTQSLKQLIGNKVSEGALVLAAKKASIVGSDVLVSGSVGKAKKHSGSGLESIITGLAIVNLTIREIVFTPGSVFPLQYSIENPPVIQSPTTHLLKDRVSTIPDPTTPTMQQAPPVHVLFKDIPKQLVSVENPFANSELIEQIKAALDHLKSKSKYLQNRYGKESDIMKAYSTLNTTLDRALKNYSDTSDLNQFKNQYNEAINTVKYTFNTHRDNVVRKFIGDVVNALLSLKDLFSSKENREYKTNRATFFDNKPFRETRSAQALYDFKIKLDKIVGELPDPNVSSENRSGPGGSN